MVAFKILICQEKRKIIMLIIFIDLYIEAVGISHPEFSVDAARWPVLPVYFPGDGRNLSNSTTFWVSI